MPSGFGLGLLVGVLIAAVIGLAIALLASGGDEDPMLEPAVEAARTTDESTETDLVITVSSQGVQSLGSFRPQAEGSVGAEEAFGSPSEIKGPGGDSCEQVWAELGLTIFFAHFGGEDACAPDAGRVGTIQVEDAAPESPRWVTAEGLRLDESVARLDQIYPGAFPLPRRKVFGLRQGQVAYSLFQMQVPFGDGSVDTLVATASGGTVDGFRLYVGAAGE